jgi:hypothetical protein
MMLWIAIGGPACIFAGYGLGILTAVLAGRRQ